MVRVLGQTSFEKGMEQGMEKGFEKGIKIGRIRGQRDLLRHMLEHAFGPLSKPARDCLEAMSSQEEFFKLAVKFREAKSLVELGLEE
jgi:hypothetical protein